MKAHPMKIRHVDVAKKANLIQLTEAAPALDPVTSTSGRISHLEFCRQTAERVIAGGRRAEVVEDSRGLISTWVEPAGE